MSTADLSPTSYLVLGLVNQWGPATPYDLKRIVNLSIGNFWSFPHSQLYAEPARLADARLLTVEQEDGGRRRRRYSITADGQEALQAWLAEKPAERSEVRDPGLLKLFFAAAADPATIAKMAAEQVEVHGRQLERLEAIEKEIAGPPELAYPLLTLELGKRIARVYVGFWSEVAGSAQPG